MGTFFSVLLFGGAILAGADAVTLGRVLWSALPGFLALVVGLRLSTGKRLWWVLSLVVCSLWFLGALGAIGRGDIRGITGLVLPAAASLFLVLPASVTFFSKR